MSRIVSDGNASPNIKFNIQVMTTEEEIKIHTQKIESGNPPQYSTACPYCAAEPQAFRRHDCRRRSFRLVVDQCVRVFRSWIWRLKCATCQQTFTDYPPFRSAPQAIRQPHGA